MSVESPIYNVISNSKFSNKEIVKLKASNHKNFNLTHNRTLIYSYFKLKKAWNVFKLVEILINLVF